MNGFGQTTPRSSRRGFTLLEILFAITLAAALMVAAITFVLSMGELWGRGSDARLFDQHVRGVTRFLESFLQQAVVPQAPTQAADGATTQANQTARTGTNGQAQPNNGRTGTGTAAQNSNQNQSAGTATQTAAAQDRFAFGNPSGYEGVPPMLMFEVERAPGVCVWQGLPLPQVECALQVTRDEGLVLLWISKLEEDYGTARPRKTQISPFVQGAEFEYFDETRGDWQRTTEPIVDPGKVYRVPQRFRVTFAYGKETRQVSIAVPTAPGGPPLR